MVFGKLDFKEVDPQSVLVATPTLEAIKNHELKNVLVAPINPSLADTAAFCQEYAIGLDVSANCVIVEAKRADKTWYAACLILATDRADINKAVRQLLGARKVSFAPMDLATSLTKMEYGGINPIGLPENWPIIIDESIAIEERVIIGSGIRGSKLLVETAVLTKLPNAVVTHIAQ